jgi:CRISPR/Cas system Type II protein with McrA/HNH and RuvC-like nuclease domain
MQFILRLLRALKRLSVSGRVAGRAGIDLPDFRTRLSNRRERILLKFRSAFDSRYKIRHEVHSTLILILDLRPLLLRGLIQTHKVVVGIFYPNTEKQNDQ